jgi:hypothetical protein
MNRIELVSIIMNLGFERGQFQVHQCRKNMSITVYFAIDNKLEIINLGRRYFKDLIEKDVKHLISKLINTNEQVDDESQYINLLEEE